MTFNKITPGSTLADKQNRPILCFDFETSDLPENGGQPIEFAALLLDPDTLLAVGEFHVFMALPRGVKIAPEAYAAHGLKAWDGYYEDRSGNRHTAYSAFQAMGEFWMWLDEYGFKTPRNTNSWEAWDKSQIGQLQALGQNVHFDLFFIDQWLGANNRKIFHFKYLDTMPLADFINRAHDWGLGWEAMPFRHPETNFPAVSLVAQGHAFGMNTEGAHGALFDARLTAAVFRRHIVELSGDLQLARLNHAAEDRARVAQMTGVPEGEL